LGAIAVKLTLPPEVVVAHLGTALALFATILAATALSFLPPPERAHRPAGRTARLVLFAAAGTYLLLFSGAAVTGSGAGSACPDWPLCNGSLAPSGVYLQDIHLVQRVVAAVVGGLLFAALIAVWHVRPRSRRVTAAAILVTG